MLEINKYFKIQNEFYGIQTPHRQLPFKHLLSIKSAEGKSHLTSIIELTWITRTKLIYEQTITSNLMSK